MSVGGPVSDLDERARRCARRVLDADEILVASHIDADGLTSAAIAVRALERAGIPTEVIFEKQLDESAIDAIANRDVEVVLFSDFGSGQLQSIRPHVDRGTFDAVVVDHHQPADVDIEYHLNPLLAGLDGAAELSGAGTAYVLARAMAAESTQQAVGTADNRDLAALAVVGAVGDMQAVGGELVGANRDIVREGVEAGVLAEGTDLSIYGKQTRPLPKLFEYATDAQIPGISGDEAGCIRFLEEIDVDLQSAGEWRTWVDLTDAERQRVASELVKHAVRRGVPADKIDSLVGTTYELVEEPVGTELRDASEFSTLLNATARYERADVGLGVCLGDRGGALERARRLLATHRRNLSEGLDWVRENGVTQERNLQWFDAGDAIKETIVGIVAGMALGADGVDADRPIVAFARKNDAETKVSARGTGALVRKGLDLSTVMGDAAAAVDGDGGGHDIAAGATVPRGEERSFVTAADDIIGQQLGRE